MASSYTEQDTEAYYDAQDSIYSSFWDPDGSIHWGYFDGSNGNDSLKACARLNQIMVGKSHIDIASKVLDFGCGNGTTAINLHDDVGCDVTGVNLSGVRIDNARVALAQRTELIKAKVAFEKASATELPFADGAFSHVWSQATLYHVHDQAAALKEAYRVLQDGGMFVFDDLLKPQPNISASAQEHVYKRLLFDTEYNFDSYRTELENVGFEVLEALDLSDHLKMSYWCLSTMTYNRLGEHSDHYAELSESYEKTAQAVVNRELGWGLFVCRK